MKKLPPPVVVLSSASPTKIKLIACLDVVGFRSTDRSINGPVCHVSLHLCGPQSPTLSQLFSILNFYGMAVFEDTVQGLQIVKPVHL